MANLSSDDELYVRGSVFLLFCVIVFLVMVVGQVFNRHVGSKKKTADVVPAPSHDKRDIHQVIIDQIETITLSISHLLDHGMGTHQLGSRFKEELIRTHQEQQDVWLEKLNMSKRGLTGAKPNGDAPGYQSSRKKM